jgi:hypothetical protein
LWEDSDAISDKKEERENTEHSMVKKKERDCIWIIQKNCLPLQATTRRETAICK